MDQERGESHCSQYTKLIHPDFPVAFIVLHRVDDPERDHYLDLEEHRRCQGSLKCSETERHVETDGKVPPVVQQVVFRKRNSGVIPSNRITCSSRDTLGLI